MDSVEVKLQMENGTTARVILQHISLPASEAISRLAEMAPEMARRFGFVSMIVDLSNEGVTSTYHLPLRKPLDLLGLGRF